MRAATAGLGRYDTAAVAGVVHGRQRPLIALVRGRAGRFDLELWVRDGRTLSRMAGMAGVADRVSNAAPGRLSTVVDVDGDGVDEIVVPASDRRTLLIVDADLQGLATRASVALPAPIDRRPRMAEPGTLVVGLEDGSVWSVED